MCLFLHQNWGTFCSFETNIYFFLMSKLIYSLSLIFLLTSCFIRHRQYVPEPTLQELRIECIDGAFNQPLAGCILVIDGKVVDTSGADGWLAFDTVIVFDKLNYTVFCTDDLHSNEYPNEYYDTKVDRKRYVFYPSEKYNENIRNLEKLKFETSDQTQEEIDSSKTEEMTMPEIEAEFPGGNQSMTKYIHENLNYPSYAMERNLEGKVFISMVIEPTGEISNIRVHRAEHPSLEQEAIRCIRNMPLWSPGKVGGQAVRTLIRLPIVFTLD
jgi:TonB family protein